MSKFHRKIISGYDEIGSGLKKVTSAATPEALASSTAFKKVWIRPLADNTAIITIGGSNVSATPTASPIGVALSKTDAPILIEGDDLSDIYIAVAVDGEGVSYTYYK